MIPPYFPYLLYGGTLFILHSNTEGDSVSLIKHTRARNHFFHFEVCLYQQMGEGSHLLQ